MITIYCNSQATELQWVHQMRWPQKFVVTHDLDHYCNIKGDTKIAFVTGGTDPDLSTVRQTLDRLSSASHLVFAVDTELHEDQWSLAANNDRHNLYWLFPGWPNADGYVSDHWFFLGDWFHTTTRVYRRLPEILAKIDSIHAKPKYFDALLGRFKPHRSFVAQAIYQNQLRDRCVLTYEGDIPGAPDHDPSVRVDVPEAEVTEPNKDWSSNRINYHGILCHRAHIMPVETYNCTAYSLVAETQCDPRYNFYTEKIAKPILARRLFVVAAGPGYLQGLQRLGFRTFDGIIDESYDLIRETPPRLAAVVRQIRYLCQQPQSDILARTRDITEHNYQVMISTDWWARARNQVTALIRKRLQNPEDPA